MAILKAAIITVTPFQQNCSVIWKEDTKIAAVNDPGGDLEAIEKFISEQGLTVSKIFITHGHLDHAAGAKELADKLDVEIEGLEWLAKKGYDPVFGARPLKRLIQKEIQDQLAEGLLSGDLKEGSKSIVFVENDFLQMRKE